MTARSEEDIETLRAVSDEVGKNCGEPAALWAMGELGDQCFAQEDYYGSAIAYATKEQAREWRRKSDERSGIA